MSIKVAILTVSDTASANPPADTSGPKIREILESSKTYRVLEGHQCIVPDDKEEIVDVVRKWSDSGDVDWIITTGGTGFGVRDVTPEAVSCLIEKPAPGLVHLILSASLKFTPLAALSRPVAGAIGNTLVVTLPGSVKAVKENLDALLQGGIVEHAIELIKGGSGKAVHAKLGGRATPSADPRHHHLDHHHHHHQHSGHHTPKPRSQAALSHDPAAPVTTRLRKSPFPLISLEAALASIGEHVKKLPIITLPVNSNLGGHVLAEDIHAPQNVPSTNTTSVDGYALRSTDPPGTYTVLTSQTHKLSDPLPAGSIYRINTGGPLPLGADTVIMVEDTRLVSISRDGLGTNEEEKEVETLVQVPPFENVRKPGTDVRKGDMVLRKGEMISRAGGEIGTLAFVGRKEVSVYKKPVVALLSTGNEIVDLHSTNQSEVLPGGGGDGWGGIYDTNRPSLQATLESLGYRVIDLGIVADNIDVHLGAIKKGLEQADLLLTTGGTSMGPTDLLKPIIERYLDGTIHFGRVTVKPGKPTTFASVPVGNISKPVFALPGNPASALVTFYVFVVPALRRMGGWPDDMCDLLRVVVQVQNTMPLDPRTEFHRVVIKSSLGTNLDRGSYLLKAYSTGGQRSSRAASLSQANGLVVLPPLSAVSNGKTAIEAGEMAGAIVLGEIRMA